LTDKDLQIDETNSNLFVQTTASPVVASVPTHRLASDSNWPTVLGIVPVSELLNKDLQKSTKQTAQSKATHQTSLPLPTHSARSNDSWPTVLGIAPLS
jgi:hypothetical protein